MLYNCAYAFVCRLKDTVLFSATRKSITCIYNQNIRTERYVQIFSIFYLLYFYHLIYLLF